MITCDKCQRKVGGNHIQISVRGEQRHRLYDFGLENTFFDLCSIKCALALLNELRVILPKVKINE